MDVVRAVATEFDAQRLVIAEEMKSHDELLPIRLQTCFPTANIETVPHEQLIQLASNTQAIVRTGDYTPFANVIVYKNRMS